LDKITKIHPEINKNKPTNLNEDLIVVPTTAPVIPPPKKIDKKLKAIRTKPKFFLKFIIFLRHFT